MPSLHVGWDLLVGLALIAAAGALWLRTVGRVMPVAMALATVLTANHYLLDVLGGVAFALAGYAGALVIERRRQAAAAGAGAAVVPAQRAPDASSASAGYRSGGR